MLTYNCMRQTIYIKHKYKKYNTIYTVHNRDSLISSPKVLAGRRWEGGDAMEGRWHSEQHSGSFFLNLLFEKIK